MRKTKQGLASAMGALVLGMAGGVAMAAPSNDDWATSTKILALPFSDTLADVQAATEAPSDPRIDCMFQGDSDLVEDSVWYEYTTGATEEFVDVAAGGYDTLIRVFEGSPQTGFVGVHGGCNDDGVAAARGSRLFGLRLAPNTRYSFLVANFDLNSPPAPTLTFSLQPSAVYRVTSTSDASDGVCDADCTLRDAVLASTQTPGAVVLPAGNFAVPGGLQLATGGGWYGAGMDRTIIDAQGVTRVVTLANDTHYDTVALHDLTLANGLALVGDATNGRGGALYSGWNDVVVLDRVAVRNSFAAGHGGGVYVYGNLAINDSVIAGNLSQASGGGIAARGWTLDVERSAIVGNEAQNTQPQQGGGGIHTDLRFDVRLSNVTVSGNRSAGEAAAYVGVYRSYANIVINNVSVVDNYIGALADMSVQGGLKIANSDGATLSRPAVIANSVIAGNRPANDPQGLADCAMTEDVVVQTHHNHVQAPNACVFDGVSNVTGTDPQLDALDTTAAMPTHQPAPGSPLIDAGDADGSCERTDARGVARPQDGNGDGVARCDVGAVELLSDRIFGDGFDAAR